MFTAMFSSKLEGKLERGSSTGAGEQLHGILPEMKTIWQNHKKVTRSLSSCNIIRVSMQLVHAVETLPGLLCIFCNTWLSLTVWSVLLLFTWTVAIQVRLSRALLLPFHIPLTTALLSSHTGNFCTSMTVPLLRSAHRFWSSLPSCADVVILLIRAAVLCSWCMKGEVPPNTLFSSSKNLHKALLCRDAWIWSLASITERFWLHWGVLPASVLGCPYLSICSLTGNSPAEKALLYFCCD